MVTSLSHVALIAGLFCFTVAQQSSPQGPPNGWAGPPSGRYGPGEFRPSGPPQSGPPSNPPPFGAYSQGAPPGLSPPGFGAPYVSHRAKHGSFIIGDFLYIDGGEYIYSNNGTRTSYAYNKTLAIDLSKDWNTMAETPGAKGPKTVEIDKGTCPNLNEIHFWEDLDGTVYAFGGEYSTLNPPESPIPPQSFWAFHAEPNEIGEWKEVTNKDDPVWTSLPRRSYGLSTYGRELGGFNLGGCFNDRTSEGVLSLSCEPAEGLQTFDFKSKSWANEPSGGIGASHKHERAILSHGAMVHVPIWGSKGLLVTIGGLVSEPSADGQQHEVTFGSMREIHVYDPASKNRFIQFATGDVPDERQDFCAVGAMGPDRSSYEIYIYGGRGSKPVVPSTDFNANRTPPPEDQKQFLSPNRGPFSQSSSNSPPTKRDRSSFSDVYILTLPSFNYYRINSDRAPGTPFDDSRIQHTCHLRGSMFLSIGGVSGSDDSNTNTWEQEEMYVEGISVFDTHSLEWREDFDAEKGRRGYERSDLVSQGYEDGNWPEKWTDPELQALFMGRPNQPPVVSSQPEEEEEDDDESPSIIGPVVGAIVGLVVMLVVAGVAMFIWHKRKIAKIEERNAMELRERKEAAVELEAGPSVGRWDSGNSNPPRNSSFAPAPPPARRLSMSTTSNPDVQRAASTYGDGTGTWQSGTGTTVSTSTASASVSARIQAIPETDNPFLISPVSGEVEDYWEGRPDPPVIHELDASERRSREGIRSEGGRSTMSHESRASEWKEREARREHDERIAQEKAERVETEREARREHERIAQERAERVELEREARREREERIAQERAEREELEREQRQREERWPL
ncbi:hypothetical protein K402DRAFT_455289 [Aulographum hederae CBS 113979]|uniref:Kelch repeat protein n=1 Tax=Aulographum hederae CBS 113979 TaxID=1176131 RepID=A0A6G1GX30_9PEZI|nr:hypothetical protein K402DRAFT_455289 [Aulographum hederae CBS 113979]